MEGRVYEPGGSGAAAAQVTLSQGARTQVGAHGGGRLLPVPRFRGRRRPHRPAAAGLGRDGRVDQGVRAGAPRRFHPRRFPRPRGAGAARPPAGGRPAAGKRAAFGGRRLGAEATRAAASLSSGFPGGRGGSPGGAAAQRPRGAASGAGGRPVTSPWPCPRSPPSGCGQCPTTPSAARWRTGSPANPSAIGDRVDSAAGGAGQSDAGSGW